MPCFLKGAPKTNVKKIRKKQNKKSKMAAMRCDKQIMSKRLEV